MGILVVAWLVTGITFGALGAWVAWQKRRDPIEGAMLGFIFLPVGTLIEAMLPSGDRLPIPGSLIAEADDEPEPDWGALGVEQPQPKPSPRGWQIPKPPPKEPEPKPGAFDWVDRTTSEG